MKDKIAGMLKKGGGLSIVAAVVLFGLALLLLSPGSSDAPPSAPPQEAPLFSLEDTERRIAAALSQIEGAGRVTVVLTLKSDGLTELATDKSITERTTPGDERNRTQSEDNVVVAAGSSVQTPVVVRQGYPEYQGALAIAEGAGDAAVRLELTRALSSLTGLGSDRITVARMRSNT